MKPHPYDRLTLCRACRGRSLYEALPLFADLNGRPALVVGGGAVAERKTLALLEAGAAVTVARPG